MRPETTGIPSLATILLVLLGLFGLSACATGGAGDPPALLAQASQDIRENRLDEARRILDTLRKTDSNDPALWNNLATLEFREAHYRQSLADLNRGISLDPGNNTLKINKARLLLAEHQDKLARAILQGLEKTRPWPPGFRILLAIAEWRTGHREAARILFQETLSNHPDDPMARAYLTHPSKISPSTLENDSSPQR
ncbi:MAG: tetratricopeptide repeat protein [Leptospirales bacterium]